MKEAGNGSGAAGESAKSSGAAGHYGVAAGYDAAPCYPLEQGRVEAGHDALAARVRPGVLALDGPAAFDWTAFADLLAAALRRIGIATERLDTREYHPPWAEILRRTGDSDLPGDPDFARLAADKLDELFDGLPARPRPEDAEVLLVIGPGAALVAHDDLWLIDRPKRHTLLAVQQGRAVNLGGRRAEHADPPRHLFVDWPILDRHRSTLLGSYSRFVDATDAARPRSVGADDLRATLAALSARPFRTLPSYLPGAWGGQWLRRNAGVGADLPNIALGYELIAPESTIVLTSPRSADSTDSTGGVQVPGAGPHCGTGGADGVEVPFDMLVETHTDAVLGAPVAERFGTSFPIRFDYLDTVAGGNLSIHCHPVERYMREVFGGDYTQHESYYVMANSPGSEVFLGLREDADIERFHAEARRAAEDGETFDVRHYVQAHPALDHQLYLIPAGTPHASGVDNLVLEISATPYLYSLRFFDWLRRDLSGGLRPVHVEHAFANLDRDRRGAAVPRDLIPRPRVLREGPGWAESALDPGSALFFEVRRLDFADRIDDATGDRFHLLNLVEGEEVRIATAAGHRQRLAYAETAVVPAAAGAYRVERVSGGPCRVVKALVR